MNSIYDKLNEKIFTKNELENLVIDIEKLIKKLDQKYTEEELKTIINETIRQKKFANIFLASIKVKSGMTPEKMQDLDKKLHDLPNTRKSVSIMTAIPILNEDMEFFAQMIQEKDSSPILINYSVDSSLIGGIKVKAQKYIYDLSLKTHLEKYKVEWLKLIKRHNES